MATIRFRKGGWQAMVRRSEFTAYGTFASEAAARDWAREHEDAIDAARESQRLEDARLKAKELRAEGLTLEIIVRNSVPRPEKKSGVYFLIKDGEIKYVGQSGDVYTRVWQHAVSKVRGGFDRVAWAPCPIEDCRRIEEFYIRKFQPEWNVALKDPPVRKRKPRPRSSRAWLHRAD